ncbi:hypothetical protein [Bacillus sinesaloumensis]|uniref:hypothetical protein n=1 Tax=Litchfieldia sinesaloumensis TaxID=1926280 RepID=UPI001F3FFED1|nr:hypothetical protein [Bacillus sinesaloumensis]
MHFRYAIYFNKKYHYDGHVFQGRYGAKLNETDQYFLEVGRYIHRNPLEAKMVKNLSSYEWSSYPAYLNLVENHHVSPQKTLSYFQEPLPALKGRSRPISRSCMRSHVSESLSR